MSPGQDAPGVLHKIGHQAEFDRRQTDFTDTVRRYVNEVRKLASDSREQTVDRNKQIDEGVFAAANDPREPLAPPKKEAVPPFLNFAPLDNGLAALQLGAGAYAKAVARASANGAPGLSAAALRQANARLISVERALTLPEGLPNRAWFKNQIYAPGF